MGKLMVYVVHISVLYLG